MLSPGLGGPAAEDLSGVPAGLVAKLECSQKSGMPDCCSSRICSTRKLLAVQCLLVLALMRSSGA